MSVSSRELVPGALRRASELDSHNLIIEALQLAERDERMRTLLQPMPSPIQNAANNNVPLENSSRRDFMCPDLYRATVSGLDDRVNELLGLVEQNIPVHDRGQDVAVLLGGADETNEKGRQWGHRIHGNGLCTLQEVTAEKNTILHIAAEHGHTELVEQIIRRDHTLMISANSRNETPLHLAARIGRCSVVALIVFLAQESGIGAYEVLTKRSDEGDTVLHEAARHGHEDVVQLLMMVAPALSAEFNNASMSPLYIATVRNSVGIVKALLDHSCPSAVGPNHQNALHAAVQRSQEITSMLLDWRAELATERDDSGNTPMHYAASSGGLTMASTAATLSVYGATLGPGMRDKMKNWRDETSKWIDRTSKNLIIVSVLVATIAFSAAFNVPGAYNGVGVANLRESRNYKIFIILDTIAMSASVSSSILLLVAKAVNKRGSWSSFCFALLFLWISLIIMQYAFVVAVSLVLGEGKTIIKNAISYIPGIFFGSTMGIIYIFCSPARLGTIHKFIFHAKMKSQKTPEVTIQLPKVGSYVKIAYSFIILSALLYFVMGVIVSLK